MENLRQPVRVNTKISADTNDWLDRKAYEMGLTKSALINIAVENYRKELEAVRSLPVILDQLERQLITKLGAPASES